MVPYKFSLTSTNITRLFAVFTLIVVVALSLMVYNTVTTWLSYKSADINDLSHAVQKRIDAYRFVTWQVYENLATSATGSPPVNNLQETRLRPDVYYLEKTRRKTDTLILGSHDSITLSMALRMSDYLDTLWGANNTTWSMYFLNGQDNSLIMISTLPLKDMATRYKESALNSMMDTRRVEMLQQANALDERESFSPLRYFAWQKDHYFTLLTTFNQPGHLATVVAFDIPVNDLVPHNLQLENIQLRQSNNAINSEQNRDNSNTQITLVNPNLELTTLLPGTSLQLVYQIPLAMLIMDNLRNLLWPLLINLMLFLLSLSGMLLLRQQSLGPGENKSAELDSLRILNEEIVASLPVGLLVYDFASNRTIISNKIAEHLLPHLNLQKIINMSDQHQGVLQATINNEIYEIRHARSVLSSHTQIFMMRDQDRELLVNKKLQHAQQVLGRNHQMRQQLLQNLGHTLNKPLKNVVARLTQFSKQRPDDTIEDILQESQALSKLVEDIVLLNQLETHDWSPDAAVFKLQEVLDEVVLTLLPLIKRKGLSLIVSNQLDSDEKRFGDRHALHKVLITLTHYALTTTTIGKIFLEASADEQLPDKLLFTIIDTGSGLNNNELANADFPFLGETSQDRFGQASGMAFFLCKQLCKQMDGQLEIAAAPQLGTRYNIRLNMPVEQQEQQEQQEEKLLDGVIILTDIAVDDVQKTVCQRLKQWGARYITADEKHSDQNYDVLITDMPERLTDWALLLVDDEPGYHALNERQYRVNYNLSSALQEALLTIIEQQLTTDLLDNSKTDMAVLSPGNGYYQLFIETVPGDIRKLYTEAAAKDYASLAKTAHRLKGVFAMLNLINGKQLCEKLEQHIKMCNDTNIKNVTSEIDDHVNQLLQQGNQ